MTKNKERGIGFLVIKRLARNNKSLYSLSDRTADLIIKLKNRYKIRIIQIYAPTSITLC